MNRVTIYTKTIIVDDDQLELFKAVVGAAEALESAGQEQGWSESVVVLAEDDVPTFSKAPPPFGSKE